VFVAIVSSYCGLLKRAPNSAGVSTVTLANACILRWIKLLSGQWPIFAVLIGTRRGAEAATTLTTGGARIVRHDFPTTLEFRRTGGR
jgi:hypothetical protein